MKFFFPHHPLPWGPRISYWNTHGGKEFKVMPLSKEWQRALACLPGMRKTVISFCPALVPRELRATSGMAPKQRNSFLQGLPNRVHFLAEGTALAWTAHSFTLRWDVLLELPIRLFSSPYSVRTCRHILDLLITPPLLTSPLSPAIIF